MIWDDPASLSPNVLEFATEWGSDGRIGPLNQRGIEAVAETGGGYLRSFRPAAAGYPSVELYIFWAAPGSETGVGEGCPGRERPGGEFGIHGSNTVGAAIRPSPTEAYAQGEGGFVERALTSDPAHSRMIVFDKSGDVELAAVDLWAEVASTSYPALLKGKALIGMVR